MHKGPGTGIGAAVAAAAEIPIQGAAQAGKPDRQTRCPVYASSAPQLQSPCSYFACPFPIPARVAQMWQRSGREVLIVDGKACKS
jgi:hypothetical protein